MDDSPADGSTAEKSTTANVSKDSKVDEAPETTPPGGGDEEEDGMVEKEEDQTMMDSSGSRDDGITGEISATSNVIIKNSKDEAPESTPDGGDEEEDVVVEEEDQTTVPDSSGSPKEGITAGKNSATAIVKNDSTDEDPPTPGGDEEVGAVVVKNEASKAQEVSDTTSSVKFRRTLAFVLIISIVAATVIGLALGLTTDDRQSGSADDRQSGSADDRQSGSPTSSPADKNPRELMKRYLINNGVNTEDDFSGEFSAEQSPQNLALDFLATQDERNLGVPEDDITSREGYKFLTRYVMTLFYFAMNGPQWNQDLIFLSKFDTCDWFEVFSPPVGQVGVICNENTQEVVGLSFSKLNSP
jgi:hypothetical protein